MEDRHDPQTWQELLRRLIEDPKEKERILQQTNIQAVTLTRWVRGVSSPRADNMRSLLNAVPPSFSQTFTQLLAVDFPNLLSEQSQRESVRSEPPLEVYVCVLNAYATMQPPLYPQVLRDLILQQMIRQFDPGHLGLAIRIAQCLWHESENKVRSLQVIGEIGTPPWGRDLGRRGVFLGAESLAGAAVTKCRLIVASRQAQDIGLNFVHWGEHEQCVLAYPVMFQTKVAGSLLIACAQPDGFSQAHYKLLECYAHLIALAFEPDAFFDLRDVALRIMPSSSHQEPVLGQFRQRAFQMAQRQSLTLGEAQERVWQEIEEELIQLAASTSGW